MGPISCNSKNKEPSYELTPNLELLNALKVTHILVDDLILALYVRESIETKQFFFSSNPPPHTMIKNEIPIHILESDPNHCNDAQIIIQV